MAGKSQFICGHHRHLDQAPIDCQKKIASHPQLLLVKRILFSVDDNTTGQTRFHTLIFSTSCRRPDRRHKRVLPKPLAPPPAGGFTFALVHPILPGSLSSTSASFQNATASIPPTAHRARIPPVYNARFAGLCPNSTRAGAIGRESSPTRAAATRAPPSYTSRKGSCARSTPQNPHATPAAPQPPSIPEKSHRQSSARFGG